jgi:hypothetical protein
MLRGISNYNSYQAVTSEGLSKVIVTRRSKEGMKCARYINIEAGSLFCRSGAPDSYYSSYPSNSPTVSASFHLHQVLALCMWYGENKICPDYDICIFGSRNLNVANYNIVFLNCEWVQCMTRTAHALREDSSGLAWGNVWSSCNGFVRIVLL